MTEYIRKRIDQLIEEFGTSPEDAKKAWEPNVYRITEDIVFHDGLMIQKIPEYPDYWASFTEGKIYKCQPDGSFQFIKSSKNKSTGYMQVNLYPHTDKHKSRRVHRLVGFAWIINPDPEHNDRIDHKTTKRDNNDASNLRWTNAKGNQDNPNSKENMSKAQQGKHPTEVTKEKISKAQQGKHHTQATKDKMCESHSKSVYCYDSETCEWILYVSGKVASEATQAAASNIAKALQGKGWGSNGHMAKRGYYWYWPEDAEKLKSLGIPGDSPDVAKYLV